MHEDVVRRFSDLGDPVLLLLAGFGVFFYLWIDDARRPWAASWAKSLVLCLTLVFASKLALYPLGWGDSGAYRMRSPSGHVAVATAFYGNLAVLLTVGRGPLARSTVSVASVALIGIVAATRGLLKLHSMPEIAAGMVIGLACLLLYSHTLITRPVAINARHLISLLVLLATVRIFNIEGEAFVTYLAQKGLELAAGIPGKVALGMD